MATVACFFLKEGGKGGKEFFHQPGSGYFLCRMVGSRMGEDETMVKPHGKKDAGKHKEGDGPRVWNVACHRFQPACQHDEQPLSGNGGNTVKGAADTYKQCLLVRIERQHVKSVGGNVVCGRTKGEQPEQGERQLKEIFRGDGEGNTCQSCTDEHLHGDNPPAFGLDEVDERTPQRLDDPGQVEPAGIKGQLGIADAQPFIHDKRDDGHCHVWQSLRKVEGGNPCPR